MNFQVLKKNKHVMHDMFLFFLFLFLAISILIVTLIKPNLYLLGVILGIYFILLISVNLEIGIYLFLLSIFFTSFKGGMITEFRIVHHLFGILIIVCFLAQVAIGKRKLTINQNDKLLYLFCFLFLTSFIFSLKNAVDKDVVYKNIVSWTNLLLIFVVVIPNILNTREKLKKGIKAILIGGFISASFGVYQFAASYLTFIPDFLQETFKAGWYLGPAEFPRSHGFMIEPGEYANSMFLVLPLGLSLFLTKSKIINYRLIKYICSISFIAIIFSLSKAGILLGILMFFLIGLKFKKRYLDKKKILSMVFGIIFIMLIVYSSIMLTEKYENRTFDKIRSYFFLESPGSRNSFQDRVNRGAIAFLIFKNYPLTGVGYGNYGIFANYYFGTKWFEKLIYSEMGEKPAINSYLQILAELGIVGFLTFLIICFLTIKTILKLSRNKYTDYYYPILSGLLVGLILMLLQFNLLWGVHHLHFWTLICMIISTNKVINIEIRGKNAIENSTYQ